MLDSNKLARLLNELEALRSFSQHSSLFTLDIQDKLKKLKSNIALRDFSIIKDLEFMMFANQTYDKHINEILNIAKDIEKDS